MAIKTPKIYTKSEWKHLSRQQKAVIVAADTIQWIKLGKFKPKSGKYCVLNKKINEKPDDIRHAKNNCIGCAKGGLFYSKCMALNKLDTSDLIRLQNKNETAVYDDPSSNLYDCFLAYDLEDIERVFEGWNPALALYKNSSNWKLLFICLHIIANKGNVHLELLNPYIVKCFHDEVVLPYVRRNRSLWRVLTKRFMKEFRV